LWALELDVFTDQANAQMLFAQPVGGNPIADNMIRIIDLWQSATGERLKDTSVAVAGTTIGRSLPVTPQPTPLPAGTVPPPPAGRRPGRAQRSGRRAAPVRGSHGHP